MYIDRTFGIYVPAHVFNVKMCVCCLGESVDRLQLQLQCPSQYPFVQLLVGDDLFQSGG